MARFRFGAWVSWFAVLVVATAVLRSRRDNLDTVHVVLTYLLVVLGGSVGGGRPLSVALTVAGVLSIDYFFQLPYDTLTVAKPLDWVVLLAFLTTAAVATQLRARLVAKAEHAEALKEADRLKDIVLASVSHDLRTPLTTIKALAQSAAQQGDQNAVAIEEQADRLGHLVADLLDLSRLKSGALPVRPELNTAEDLVGAALRQISGVLRERTVQTTLDLNEPALVGRFDFVQSLRILNNLLENAVRYSPGSAPVELAVHREGRALVFAVADRGPGIPPSERERIFEPFYRPAGAPGDVGGAGLGLAIARRLAELQGGSLEYAPRTGGGSIFMLRLPASPSLAHDVDPDGPAEAVRRHPIVVDGPGVLGPRIRI
jgi:K+-sensing histidine kinase KdpD